MLDPLFSPQPLNSLRISRACCGPSQPTGLAILISKGVVFKPGPLSAHQLSIRHSRAGKDAHSSPCHALSFEKMKENKSLLDKDSSKWLLRFGSPLFPVVKIYEGLDNWSFGLVI